MDNRKRILNDIKGLHTSSYLTVMSITQGVALTFLAIAIKAGYENNQIDTLFIIQSIFTFIIIVTVWHEYSISVASLTWIPGMWDSLIPFLFSLSEIYLAQTIGDKITYWYYGMFVFCMIGFIAFINMYYKSDKLEENYEILSEIRLFRHISTLFPLIAMLIFLYLAFTNNESFGVFLACASVIIISFQFRTYFYWKTIVSYSQGKN